MVPILQLAAEKKHHFWCSSNKYLFGSKAINNLARAYSISQDHIRSRKAIFDLGRLYSISQGHIRSRKTIFDLVRPSIVSQSHGTSRKAMLQIRNVLKGCEKYQNNVTLNQELILEFCVKNVSSPLSKSYRLRYKII